MTVSDYFLYSLIGMLVVFFALILLMILIKLMTKLIPADDTNNFIITENDNNIRKINPSRCVNIYDTNPRDAALIMAIVADNLEIPVNQLDFISIKEVKK